MIVMPWKGWDNAKDKDPRHDSGSRHSRWLHTRNDPQVSDGAIDKLLRSNKNPRSALKRTLQQMSPEDRRKVEGRIRAREGKAKQGKKPGR